MADPKTVLKGALESKAVVAAGNEARRRAKAQAKRDKFIDEESANTESEKNRYKEECM